MKLIEAPNKWLAKSVNPFDFDKLDAIEVSGKMCQIMMIVTGIFLCWQTSKTYISHCIVQ